MGTNGNGNGAAPKTTDYPGAFPNSSKVYVNGPRGVRVPMREIALAGDEPPLRVYDTSGPREYRCACGTAEAPRAVGGVAPRRRRW